MGAQDRADHAPQDGSDAGDGNPSARDDLVTARTFLFVPGDRRDRFEKAAASGADIVICDLEDAVPVENKAVARSNVVDWLATTGLACVRINPIDSVFFEADRAALMTLAGGREPGGAPALLGVVVPKSQEPDELAALHRALPGVPLVALVETALGLHRAYEIAATPGVDRLAFGSIDFALDTSASHDDTSLLYARSTLVVASRAAGKAAPIDGITTALDDEAIAGDDAVKARNLGFGGKLCVHPRQVAAVNAAFTPTDDDVRWARHILDLAHGDGAARANGQMIDKPVIERARQILRRSGRLGHAGDESSAS